MGGHRRCALAELKGGPCEGLRAGQNRIVVKGLLVSGLPLGTAHPRRREDDFGGTEIDYQA